MPGIAHIAAVSASLLVACATVDVPRQKWFEVRDGVWMVEPSTVGDLREKIEDAVRDLANERSGPFLSWDNYTFQYQGQGSEERPYVYINAFCDLGDPKTINVEFVRVYDGGTCYFQVKYDPRTGQFFDLYVNGVA